MEEIKEQTNETRTADYLREKKIVFLTAKKLVNAIESGRIKCRDLNMIIFDECHHTSDKHPYHEIMRFYRREIEAGVDKSKMPIIVGLTASLGVGRSDNAIKQLIMLCLNLYTRNVSSLTKAQDLEDLNVIIYFLIWKLNLYKVKFMKKI